MARSTTFIDFIDVSHFNRIVRGDFKEPDLARGSCADFLLGTGRAQLFAQNDPNAKNKDLRARYPRFC
jgi:hypothetical protein